MIHSSGFAPGRVRRRRRRRSGPGGSMIGRKLPLVICVRFALGRRRWCNSRGVKAKRVGILGRAQCTFHRKSERFGGVPLRSCFAGHVTLSSQFNLAARCSSAHPANPATRPRGAPGASAAELALQQQTFPRRVGASSLVASAPRRWPPYLLHRRRHHRLCHDVASSRSSPSPTPRSSGPPRFRRRGPSTFARFR